MGGLCFTHNQCFIVLIILDANDPKCPWKSIVIVNECHVCAQSFPCKDITVVSYGHTYHVSCIAYVVTTHQSCKVVDCGQAFHHNWLSAIGIWPLNEDALTSLKAQSPMRLSWLQKLKDKANLSNEILLETSEIDFLCMNYKWNDMS